MNTICNVSLLTALSVVLISAPTTANADQRNRLKDPSFELQLDPSRGGWINFGVSGSSPDAAQCGIRSNFNGAFAGVAGSFQELRARPGSKWRMTGFGLTADPITGAPEAAFGVIQVTFFDEFGNDIGTVETAGAPFPAKPSNPVNSTSPTNQWIFLDTGVVTAPPGAATIQAFTLVVDFTFQTFTGVFFDDVKLVKVRRNEDEDEDEDDELECEDFVAEDDDDDDDDDD